MSAIERIDNDTSLESIDRVGIVMQEGVVGQITKSEVEAQLDAAHKYPRSVKRFLNEAITLATFNEEIAASCMYAVPRGQKVIEGPSVRLAEICISAYGNLHVGARVIGAEDKEVVSQGVCWDLEKNNRVTIEKRRKILDRNGARFNDDMINVTGNAAASIALRDAAFRVIPRTYVNLVYNAARKVAVGEASTFAARRDEVFQKLVKMGAMPDRILGRIGKAAIEDIGIAELQILIGFGTAIHSGGEKVDDIFPAVVASKGKVDLDSLKPASEANRGHGNENLNTSETTTKESAPTGRERKVKQAPKAAPDPPATTQAAPAQEECSIADFEMIEQLLDANRVSIREAKDRVVKVMGFAVYGDLTKNRMGELTQWIAEQGEIRKR